MRSVPSTQSNVVTVGAGDTLLLPYNSTRMALLLRVTTFVSAFFIIGNPSLSNFIIQHNFIFPILLLRRIDYGPALGEEIWVRSVGVSKVAYLETLNDDVLAGYLSF